MAASFSQSGGARVGLHGWLSLSLSWPFAWIEVSQSRLEFSVFPFFFLRPCVLSPATVRRLSIYTGLRPGGFVRPPRYLRVEHRLHGYPPFLLFYSFNLPELARKPTQCGFRIEDA